MEKALLSKHDATLPDVPSTRILLAVGPVGVLCDVRLSLDGMDLGAKSVGSLFIKLTSFLRLSAHQPNQERQLA